jgi:hypothetical protein
VKNRIWKFSAYLFTGLFAIALVAPFHSRGDKMKPEEIVAKHLESVGAAETFDSIRSRIIAGPVVAVMRAPGTAKFEGQAILASEGSKNTIGMGFEKAGKYEERFAFDGSNVTVGYARPGNRGYWGDFLLTHENIIKMGLVGGVLSDAWPLRNLSESKQKLEYDGMKKIDNRSVHEIKYIPKGSSDLEIKLFFDAETFRHVRTEYSRVISAGLGSGQIPSGRAASAAQSGAIDQSGQQRPTRYKMTEQFADFKKEGGLTLPHNYKIGLELDTRGGTLVIDWEFNLNQFEFNQQIPATIFVVDK